MFVCAFACVYVIVGVLVGLKGCDSPECISVSVFDFAPTLSRHAFFCKLGSVLKF